MDCSRSSISAKYLKLNLSLINIAFVLYDVSLTVTIDRLCDPDLLR